MKKVHSLPGVRHQNKLSLTMPSDMFEQVKSEAGKKSMPVATWIRVALVEYLESRVSDTANKDILVKG